MKSKFLLIAVSALFAAAALLSGCGSDNNYVVEDEPVETEAEPALNTIGEPITGENVLTANLTNETGRDIIGFAMKVSEDTEFGANLMDEGDVFTAGEERILYYDAADAFEAAAAQTGTDPNEPVLEPAFDIQLTLKAAEEGGEDTVVVLHQFPFGDLTAGELRFEDEVAFVTYVSSATGEELTTKEAELKLKEDEAAAAAAPAASTTTTTTTQQNSTSSSTGSSSNSGSGSGSSNSGSGSSGSDSGSGSGGDSGSSNQGGSSDNSGGSSGGGDDSGCIGDEGLVY
ncbi:MAG: hypothetical protein ACOX8R_08190 [Bacillota bacterium]|jgi:hypothetical protein